MTHNAPEPKRNLSVEEINKFDQIASRWWDPESEFKPLHDINPVRMGFIQECIALAGKKLIDIGCGGGILSEAMAHAGAKVTGIDLAQQALQVARLHLFESNLDIDYLKITAEEHAQTHQSQYDAVTCMEMLEHVPNPQSVIAAAASMVKPGGHLFFSTINRNAKSYLQAILGAEYLLQMLPKGTHEYSMFIRPSELGQMLRQAGLKVQKLAGMTYNPITKIYKLCDHVDVNYLVHATKTDC